MSEDQSLQRKSAVTHSAESRSIGRSAAHIAKAQVGAPYRYGGSNPSGFDCSGLVYFSYGSAGYRVPRTSAQQYRASSPIPVSQARPGDLLFFRYERQVSHVGIYLGNQRFVHAPSSGKHVTTASLRDAHYRKHFVGAGRLAVRQ